jgi:hypothetical protein
MLRTGGAREDRQRTHVEDEYFVTEGMRPRRQMDALLRRLLEFDRLTKNSK